MGKRSRRRVKGGDSVAPAAATTDYSDDDGNVLTLRDELSPGTLRVLRDLDAKPAASAEDRCSGAWSSFSSDLRCAWRSPACRWRAAASRSAATAWPVPANGSR